ncbi:hypothetical protein AB0368_31245 [Actinoplanes sp. NPDC051475]|uniref:hypothetical protein n=1 Tax=Actinoplanes sp. NPDC051475 TaxID=3157225 RepID=UPI00344DE6BA
MAAVSLAGGLSIAPGAAYAADTTTRLSAAQMVAALKPVATASTAAAAAGWRADVTITGTSMSGSASYRVDPSRGIAYDQFRLAGSQEAGYAVAGKGLYRTLPDRASRAAVKMMGRPTVKYVFTPDGSLTLAKYLKDDAPTPAVVLSDDVDHAGTKTVHDDGSADYVQVVDGQTTTLQVGPAGTLSGARAQADSFAIALTYTYAPQTITPPAANSVIGAPQLTRGLWYLQMPAAVKQVSYAGAAEARLAARGSTVKVASLRKAVRRVGSMFNTKAQLKMIKVKDVRGGVRVYATNPWTHKTVSYAVTASGKKVVVRS